MKMQLSNFWETTYSGKLVSNLLKKSTLLPILLLVISFTQVKAQSVVIYQTTISEANGWTTNTSTGTTSSTNYSQNGCVMGGGSSITINTSTVRCTDNTGEIGLAGSNRWLDLPSLSFVNNTSNTSAGTLTVKVYSNGGGRAFRYYITDAQGTAIGSAGSVIETSSSVPNGTCADVTFVLPAITGAKVLKISTNGNSSILGVTVKTYESGTPPTVTTTGATALTGTTATATGTITAGTATIVTSGVCWSTSPLPTITDSKTTNGPTATGSIGAGTGGDITGLTINTTYYVRAYASTAGTTVYGDAVQFTTPIPDYRLTSNTGALDFGAVAINTSAVQSYTVSGKLLSPAAGNITVTAPTGFTISISAAGPFTSSLLLPYTGNTLASTTIYVKFSPTVAFATSSGTITLSGGGVSEDLIFNETVTGRGKLSDPVVTSNVGNDFWLGFGYHTAMDQTDGDRANLSIYISAPDKDATVVIEMPGLGGGFVTQEVTVLKGTVQEVSGFPLGDGTKFNSSNQPDSRLYFTGISNRAIHVYSKDGTPVSVWMYSYSTDNSAAGSMIFPTNTWNTSYSVQAYGNSTNSGNPNSFFYVIAQEDGTEFDFVPSVDILDSATGNLLTKSPTGGIKYFAGQTYHITLNQGQVFNAMSGYAGSAGLDLTGTTVKSTNCKKIAVFGGNGRTIVDVNIPTQGSRSGSDNLVQQMFPKVAWGTKYYTTPTKHMEYNLYRISVDDPTTQVWVNDPTHTTPLVGLTNGYFEYQSNLPSIIESDKPISVTQFIASQVYATGKYVFGGPSEYGMNGLGDPEMIILSPAQQAINKVTVYTPTFKNGKSPAGAYINVVIPKSGVNSFKLDFDINPAQMVDTGSSSYTGNPLDPATALISVANAFIPYDKDANYYYARFKVDFPAAHTLTSDVPFNAIAYGTNDGESYGFNAGTQVNDLTSPLILNNPYGDSLNSLNSSKPLTTCKGTEVTLSATLPFANPAGHPIVFSYGSNANITPNADDVIANPVLSNTFEFNGQTFYVYKLDQKHIFNANGDYQINVTYFNPTPSDGCGGEGGSNKTISYTIRVVDGIAPAYTIDYNTCISSTVTLNSTGTSGLGYDIVKWNWSYDNGSKPLPGGQDIVQNPTFANPANNTAANVKLIAINSIGCFGELQKQLPVQTKPVITFNALPTGLCNTPTAAFDLSSYATPANGVFSGNGVELREGKYWFNPAATSVSTTAPNVITYNFTGGNSCVADPKTQSISVGQSVVLTLAAVNPLCINAAAVTLVTNNIAGGVLSGPGVSGGKFDPAVAGVGLHTVTYSKTGDACSTPASINIQVVGLPTVSFTNEFAPLCNNVAAITLNQATPAGGVYSGNGVSLVDGVYKFNPAATNVTGSNVITYTVTNTTGCVNSATNTINVTPVPVVSAGPDLSVVQNLPITITGTSNSEASFAWTPTTGLTGSTSSLVTQAQINQLGDYVYRLTATSGNCSAFDEMTLSVVSPLPCLDPMKAFTPNGDGKNEVWRVYRDLSCFVKVQVDVYNRWGGLVYHADSYSNNWTGEFKGKAVPDATYYYVIKATDGTGRTQTKTGNVTIIR